MKAAIGLAGGAAVVLGMHGMSSSVLGLAGLMVAVCWVVSGWLID